MYYYEIVAGTNGFKGASAGDLLIEVGNGTDNEFGDPNVGPPACTSAPATVDRRTVIIASVNCGDPNNDGDTSDAVTGNDSGVEIDEYFYAFFTEPPVANGGDPSENSIYMEIIRKLNADLDPILIHEFPVLNR
jgi:hypothetical protein